MIDTIQRESVISFPFLGLEMNPPASFELFGREVYFYGVLIALGFILAMFYCSKTSKRFGLDEDDIYDLMIFLLPAVFGGSSIWLAIPVAEIIVCIISMAVLYRKNSAE